MNEQYSNDIRSFLDYLRFERRYSQHTVTAYETDITSFFIYMQDQYGAPVLKEIRQTYIRSWLAGLKDKKLTARSINRKLSSLRSFFKYYLKRGAITVVPTANLIAPKPGKRLPVFIKEDDTKKLLKTLNTATEDWKTLNARMIISLFYVTGMRLSELINLKENQLDKSRGQVRVLGKGNKERIIPLNSEAFDSIDEYIKLKRKTFETPGDLLLVTEKGRKIYPKYAWLLVNKYLGEASTLSKKSPHVIRHTFATHLMNNGASLGAVKELLGHASLAATQVYTHNTIEKLKDVYKKAHPKS